MGMREAKFLLVCDNGYFSECGTFRFSDWLTQTPKDIVAKSLNVPASDLIKLPKKQELIT